MEGVLPSGPVSGADGAAAEIEDVAVAFDKSGIAGGRAAVNHFHENESFIRSFSRRAAPQRMPQTLGDQLMMKRFYVNKKKATRKARRHGRCLKRDILPNTHAGQRGSGVVRLLHNVLRRGFEARGASSTGFKIILPRKPSRRQ